MISYRKRRMDLLTKAERTILYGLTFRGYGSGMKDRLNGFEGVDSNTHIIMALDTEIGRFVGWSFAELMDDKRADVGVFVSYRYRRRGIGSRLVEKVTELVDTEIARCWPHDEIATAFYKRFGAKRYKIGHKRYADEASFRVK